MAKNRKMTRWVNRSLKGFGKFAHFSSKVMKNPKATGVGGVTLGIFLMLLFLNLGIIDPMTMYVTNTVTVTQTVTIPDTGETYDNFDFYQITFHYYYGYLDAEYMLAMLPGDPPVIDWDSVILPIEIYNADGLLLETVNVPLDGTTTKTRYDYPVYTEPEGMMTFFMFAVFLDAYILIDGHEITIDDAWGVYPGEIQRCELYVDYLTNTYDSVVVDWIEDGSGDRIIYNWMG